MTDRIPEIVFLVILAALVAGFFLGRRKGRDRLQAALSSSRAEGHAEAAADLRAQLTQSVHVTAGNTVSDARSLESFADAERFSMIMRYLHHESGALDSDNGDDGAGLDNYRDLLRDVRELHVPRNGDPLIGGGGQRDRVAIDRAPNRDGLEGR